MRDLCANWWGTGRSQRGHPRPDRADSEDDLEAPRLLRRIAGRPSGPARPSRYHSKNLASDGQGARGCLGVSGSRGARRDDRASLSRRGRWARPRSARSNWLVALVALLGPSSCDGVRLACSAGAGPFAAKRAAQVSPSHSAAPARLRRRTQLKLPSRQRSPECGCPRCSPPLPDAGARRARTPPCRGHPRAMTYRCSGWGSSSRNRTPPSPSACPIACFVDTQPHGAQVWLREFGKATRRSTCWSAQAPSGCAAAAGYHMFRTTVDAGARYADPPCPGTGSGPGARRRFSQRGCRTSRKVPVFIDEVETGLLCPAHLVRWRGTHRVGAFVRRSASWRR